MKLKKTSAMKVVTLKDNFFSKSQLKELKPVLIKNKLDYEKEHAPNYIIAAGAAALGLIANVVGYDHFAVALFAGSAKPIFDKMQDQYRTASKDRYDTVAKIKAVKDPQEQEALKVGIEADNVTGYLNSYRSLSAFKCPRAFAAAVAFKNEGKSDIVKAIARLGS